MISSCCLKKVQRTEIFVEKHCQFFQKVRSTEIFEPKYSSATHLG